MDLVHNESVISTYSTVMGFSGYSSDIRYSSSTFRSISPWLMGSPDMAPAPPGNKCYLSVGDRRGAVDDVLSGS